MYPTDKEYQMAQKKRAQAVIDFAAQRYSSNERRIQELDYWRSFYQAFGEWQTAIDMLEAQMIAWGRVERAENATLYGHYTEEMNRYWVDGHKEEWDDEDCQKRGYFLAYARARYAVRFLSVADALVYLEQDLQNTKVSRETHKEVINKENRLNGDGYIDGIQLVIEQLKYIISKDDEDV